MSRAPTAVADLQHEALVAHASRSAQIVADRCGIVIREIQQPDELEQVSRLLSVVWNREVTNRPITAELLRAFAATGNYVAGAFANDALIGASVGFFAAPERNSMHSHMTGVVDADTARNVGCALKLNQRAWALQRGVATITWTFDPLVRRNAYFNISKLGARAVEYLPHFYGEMRDRINAGDQTDRLLVEWTLLAPEALAACDHDAAAPRWDDRPLATVLSVDADDSPKRGAWEGQRVMLAVPADIEGMRRQSPALAHEWRLAVRDVLGEAMAHGARIVGFRRSEGYILESGEATHAAVSAV